MIHRVSPFTTTRATTMRTLTMTIIVMHLAFHAYSLPIATASGVLGARLVVPYLFPKEDSSQNATSSCQDLADHCSGIKNLCKNVTYMPMMQRECAFTCEYCQPITRRRRDALLPDIQSDNADPSRETRTLRALSASSLSKTIIKGTCFDEYIYCSEFSAMCRQNEYEELMERHCALTCGRCDVQHKERETCEDNVECQGLATLCDHPIYTDVLTKQCRKTCNICTPEPEGCKNRHKNCAGFKKTGFCENPVYTIEERKYLCGIECGLCNA